MRAILLFLCLTVLAGCGTIRGLGGEITGGSTAAHVVWCDTTEPPIIIDRPTLLGGGQSIAQGCKEFDLKNTKDYDSITATFTAPNGAEFTYEAIGVDATSPLEASLPLEVERAKRDQALFNMLERIANPVPNVQE